MAEDYFTLATDHRQRFSHGWQRAATSQQPELAEHRRVEIARRT